MTFRIRNYSYDNDLDSAQRFLWEIFKLTGNHYSWIPTRLENERHGPCGSEDEREDDSKIRVWEHIDNEEPTMVALTILEPNGIFWMNVHPEHHELVREIIPALEEQRRKTSIGDEEELKTGTPVSVNFESRIGILKEFGYEDDGLCEHNQIRPLELPPPDFQPPEGYTVKHVILPDDFEQYSDVVNTVFAHCGMTEKLAMLYTEAGFYNDDLDLVVEAPDGSFAAFVTVRIHPDTRMAELEPVGTHPDHRGKGLGKAVCAEGIRRVQKYNPSCIVILGAASTEGAARLYAALGFIKEDVHLWKKTL
ncbi:MAG: GNAT family N-acetyltransferase [Candidatus Thorarchaeota archaeon]|jgi:GNAT superfamily N-acetyltransferase